MGRAYAGLGRYAEALRDTARALEIAAELRDPATGCELENDRGEVLAAAGRAGAALVAHRSALATAAAIGARAERARAHERIAALLASLGDREGAHRHRDAAATGYATLGLGVRAHQNYVRTAP
jgi:tetratricopeptide (TPR) repeat protein